MFPRHVLYKMALNEMHLLESAQTSFPLTSSSSTSVLDVQSPLNAQINLKLQNILMLLKRCCNHPYLVEYPLDPATQEFMVIQLNLFGAVIQVFNLPCVCDSKQK